MSSKRRLSQEAGIQDHHRRLPADVTQEQVAEALDDLAADPAVSGILLQLPLPAHLDAKSLIDRIPWDKDVDGLTTTSAGRLARNIEGLIPCTPLGVISLLEDEGVQLQGTNVVVGRSDLVGKPLSQLLLQRNATVTIAHSKTKDLAAITRQAQVLITAAGVPPPDRRRARHPGTVVVDVGIRRTADGLIGDVDFDATSKLASKITPVPGGVGPMTIAELLGNTLKAAQLQN